jgi:adenosylmethionine-8-amino-7-oxononanoate aminotransferase
VREVEQTLDEAGDRASAFVMEPRVQGAGSMSMHPEGYLSRVAALCRDRGVWLMLDEVLTAFGRTGAMFAFQKEDDVRPDVVALAKGLTGGYMPLAATVARDGLFDMFLGHSFDRALPHGHSFTANPLACAVALAAQGLYEEEQTMARIGAINARHRAMLEVLAARTDVSKPRVLGSVLAFEVQEGGQYQSEASRKLRAWYLANGFNIRPIGSTVYLMPPYCITDEELTRAYGGMIEGLDRLASGAL